MAPAMVSTDGGQDSAAHPTGRFATTQWSVVLQAGGQPGTETRRALEQLCRTYWYPLYAFARRGGASPAEAQDLTQGFFVHLLQGELIRKADPAKGKFRSFLLTSFKHFMSSQEARASAKKRGGAGQLLFIDPALAETWFSREARALESAEQLFDRTWAATVLEQALDQLAGEFRKAGKTEAFNELSPLLQGEKAEGGYAGLAHKLGTPEGTLKWMVRRMRGRYRELIHDVIAETVDSPGEVEEEVQHLIAVLRS